MSTSNLTARILAILTTAPQFSADIWDTLSDENVRQSDVTDELHALVTDGIVQLVDITGQPWGYSLVAQAVAS